MSKNIQTIDRIQRIETIKDALKSAKKQGKKIDFTQFFAILSLNLGVTTPKIEEYCEKLRDSGQILYKKREKLIEWRGNL